MFRYGRADDLLGDFFVFHWLILTRSCKGFTNVLMALSVQSVQSVVKENRRGRDDFDRY